MRKPLKPLALSAPLVLSVALVGFGHAWPAEEPSTAPPPTEDPEVEAVVDHRQGAMSVAGGSMSALAAVVLDGAPYEDRLETYAGALRDVMSDIPAFFPEESDHPESDARAAVWDDRETFRERAEAAAEAAAELADAVERNDQAAAVQAFGGLGNACGACHEDFRN